MKKLLALFLVIGLVLGLSACSGDSEETDEAMKVGILLTLSGFGDNNFNDMAKVGLDAAKEEFGVEWDHVQPGSSADYLSQLRQFAQTEEYEIIFAMGFDMAEAINEVAEEFPEQKFTIIDGASQYDNLNGVFTKVSEQTFLAGVLAGLITQDGVMPNSNAANAIGVLYGMELPNILSGGAGFTAGAKYVNPDVEVYTKTANSFADAALGKTLSDEMFNANDVDVILAFAGGTGMGVFASAVENGYYAIGAGSNQNILEPDAVVASAMRVVNEAIYQDIERAVNGEWEGGTRTLGFFDGVLALETEGNNLTVPQDVLDTVSEIEQMILDGELTVPDTDTIDEWLSNNTYKK